MTSRVLICNTSSLTDNEICTSLSPSSPLLNNTSSLSFNNKYFTVDIELHFSKDVPVEEVLDTAEAIIYVFEVVNEDALKALEGLKKFDSFLEDQSPEIKLLFCPAVSAEMEQVLLTWCMEHYFELVQIPGSNKNITPDDDDDETLFEEKYGYDRVLQALECHMWPYRVNKEDKTEKEEEFSDFVSNSAQTSSALNELEDMMNDEDGDSFEEMFANMARMKEVAGQLPDEERKKFAEKVAMSFWRSLGGEESELEGLGDL